MKKEKKKKKYERPKIIYQKEIETMAVICNSALAPWGGCKTSGEGCGTISE
jgi:hypothetical protein